MRTYVIGSGGREFELGRQFANRGDEVVFGPGNAGTAVLDNTQNVAIGPTEVEKIVDYVRDNNVDLTVIGPDAAVAAGVGNALREAGKAVFGPTKEAGRLEASKIFATEFMLRHNIPHPPGQIVYTLEEALAAIDGRDPSTYVLKADGLAAGKGAFLPDTAAEAEATLRGLFDGSLAEGAGKTGVIISDRYHGPEVSAFAVTDGKNRIILPLVQDHKRLLDGDRGPNTGGMGVHTLQPGVIVSEKQHQKIVAIIDAAIKGMAEEGTPYQGALYVGIMLAEETNGDPVVIEFNARFGDPETEAQLAVMAESGYDVAEMISTAAKGDVGKLSTPEKISLVGVTVALAAAGYPSDPKKGDEIFGLDKHYDGVIVQHAGTKFEDGKWLTNGGRVLYVTGIGSTTDEAAAKAYAAIGDQGIHFAGMQFRKDIGYQARSQKS